MRKQSEEFGEAVRKLLGERGLSLRQAKYKTGIDHATIMDMSHGFVPRQDLVMQWAQGLGESVNKWLRLAGYQPIDPRSLMEDSRPFSWLHDFAPEDDPLEGVTIALHAAKNLSDLSRKQIIEMVKEEIEKAERADAFGEEEPPPAQATPAPAAGMVRIERNGTHFDVPEDVAKDLTEERIAVIIAEMLDDEGTRDACGNTESA